MLWFRRIAIYLAIVGVGVSLSIGFVPMHAKVYGNASYNCGSGFVHNNGNRYNIDSASSKNERTAQDTATGTPSQVCPDIVHNQRDLSLWVGVIAIVVGCLGVVFTSGRRSRMSRALFGAGRVRQWR